jgi:cobalt-zinc-cadmium efflux system membrane fusion protein
MPFSFAPAAGGPWVRRLAIICLAVGAVVALSVLAFVPSIREHFFPASKVNLDEGLAEQDEPYQPAQLVPNKPNTVRLAPQTARLLGIQTEVVKVAPQSDTLRLTGSLFLDANRRMNIHTPFTGQVVELGKSGDERQVGRARVLRVGDRVKENELLAVVWSKEIGEKKSDLVAALSEKYLDEAKLKRLKSLPRGVVSDRTIEDAERDYEADLIAVYRAERTLRSWKVDEAEIAEVREEADRIRRGEQVRDTSVERRWAEVDIVAPFDGVILEKNIAVGDIVDTNVDLFKIADLSELAVLVNVYEEDLPKLERLTPEQRKWKVHLKSEPSAPPLEGTFDLIGHLIDPNQHTAAVTGWLSNPDGRLRVGQFITATVELPRHDPEVSVAESAVLEDGQHAYVFVAADAEGTEVTRREVAVAKRAAGVILLRSRPTAEEQRAGVQPLAPGERIVRSGVVLLAGAMRDLLEQHPEAAESAEAAGVAARPKLEDHQQ